MTANAADIFFARSPAGERNPALDAKRARLGT